MPSETPEHLPPGPSTALSLRTVSCTHRAPQGLMGTCMSPPQWGGPGLSPPPALPRPTHLAAQISHSVFSTRTQGRWHYRDSGPKQIALSSHHPPLGPPLGKSRVFGRKDTDGLANEAPGRYQPQRKCQSSAHTVRKGTVPPISQAPSVQGREKPLQGQF